MSQVRLIEGHLRLPNHVKIQYLIRASSLYQSTLKQLKWDSNELKRSHMSCTPMIWTNSSDETEQMEIFTESLYWRKLHSCLLTLVRKVTRSSNHMLICDIHILKVWKCIKQENDIRNLYKTPKLLRTGSHILNELSKKNETRSIVWKWNMPNMQKWEKNSLSIRSRNEFM